MDRKIIALLCAIMLLPFVAAKDDGNVALLTASAAVAQCRSDFTVGVMKSIETNLPATASILDPAINKLTADTSQLSQLATGGDKDKFRDAVKSFDADLKQAHDAVQNARQSVRGKNVTKDYRDKMKSDFDSLKEAMGTCSSAQHKQFGQLKIQAYLNAINDHQTVVDKLKNKSIDTSALDALLSDAKNQIAAQQAAVNAATDEKSTLAAIQSFCLYDGCKSGVNDHLEAKIELQKLTLLLAYYEKQWNMTTEQISAVQTKLDAAKSALTSLGTAQYTPSTQSAVWDNIKAAATALKAAQPQHGKNNKQGGAQ